MQHHTTSVIHAPKDWGTAAAALAVLTAQGGQWPAQEHISHPQQQMDGFTVCLMNGGMCERFVSQLLCGTNNSKLTGSAAVYCSCLFFLAV